MVGKLEREKNGESKNTFCSRPHIGPKLIRIGIW